MRAEVAGLELTAAQSRVAELTGSGIIRVVGPPASGKTTALAAHALRCSARSEQALIICSHDSSCRAFRAAFTALHPNAPQCAQPKAALLSEHLADWMRREYLAAGCLPDFILGTSGAARQIVERAARGLLDMTWPIFRSPELSLDIPHLGRPDAFLDEAASLISLLQRTRISPEEFEAGTEAGLAAFYGQNVERAIVLVQDAEVRERASSRGAAALRVNAATLAEQRRAEQGAAAILALLYREYVKAAQAAAVRAPEDVIDSAVRWLSRDARSASRFAGEFQAIVVDDAEDAEPGLVPILEILHSHASLRVIVSGSEQAAIDGFEGRRSALPFADHTERIELAPLGGRDPAIVQRFDDETAETRWIGEQIQGLLFNGVPPGSIAVLCRSEDAAAVYALGLRESGLPVSLPPSGFEDAAELFDLLALCAVVFDPFDTEQLLRVLSSPLLGLSDSNILALCRDASGAAQLSLAIEEQQPAADAQADRGMLACNVMEGQADALLPESARGTLQAFRKQLRSWHEETQSMSPAQCVGYVARAAGFVDRWQSAPEIHRRHRLLEDLQRITEAVGRAAYECGNLSESVRQLEDGLADVRPADQSPDGVVTNSIVGAKGQNWPHVFIAGVAHERFPRIYASHAMAFSRTYGLIVRENVTRGAAQTAKYAWYYAKFGAKSLYLHEERRALYYGLSRATVRAAATGFGTPPYWARDHDLLSLLQETPS